MKTVAPFVFRENRVWRVYRGGKMIDLLRNKENPEDGEFPEDWIASGVVANNPQRNIPLEGVSTAVFEGQDRPFPEILRMHPEEILGARHLGKFGPSLGFLAKILDSAIRLPIQAHPSRKLAKRLYGSDFGKTEAWIVLGTRQIDGEKPYLMLGFNDSLDKDVFSAESMTGEMARSLGMVHRHDVKAGDVILLRGGLVHAIGSGVFMIEIMEPSDLVVQPELFCGRQVLSEGDRFGAISPSDAMEVFDFKSQGKDEVWNSCVIPGRNVSNDSDSEFSILIDRDENGYFGAERLKNRTSYRLDNVEGICRAGIVCKGSLLLSAGGEKLELRQGDTFFLPASLEKYEFQGAGEIIFALPPPA